MSREVQFKRVPLHTLLPHPSNYNQHPPAQIAELKASLMRYKQVRPIVVQQAIGDEQYIILAGHGITAAAKELYAEHPAKYTHLNSWAVVIAPSEWSLLDAKGYMVSDNALGRKAELDQEILGHILQEQHDAGFDLASLGADATYLSTLLENMQEPFFEPVSEEEQGRLDRKDKVTCPECGCRF
jgi:ParB-like nuclease family protein